MTNHRLPDADAMTVENAARARELRRAGVLVATHAVPGRLRTNTLHALALMIADLEGMPAIECRSCGVRFGVGRDEMKFYRSRGLSIPMRCRRCRKRGQRHERAEREKRPHGD